MQALRQHPVLQGQHHLDQTGCAGGGFEMADVGLDRSHQQRPVGVAGVAVGGRGGLHLDRVAQRGARAVRLQVVDVTAGQPGAGQHRRDEPLLGTAVGNGQPAGGAVLIHRAGGDDRTDPIAVAHRVAEPFENQDAASLATDVAVCGRVEGLAPPGGGQHAGAGRRDDGDGTQQHVDPAGHREIAVAGMQRLARLVHRDQRRTACGVHGHGGPFEAQGEGDPAGDRVERVAGDEVRFDLVDGLGGEQVGVLVGGYSHEHPGAAAAQGRRRKSRSFQPLPHRLQHQPLLRLDPDRLAR